MANSSNTIKDLISFLDDVRAKLRLTVKKILMRYGYPPDLAKMEADKVLRQGEALAEMFSSGI